MKMSKRRFIQRMSGMSRRSIFSPGNPGIATNFPPWTVLHKWFEIFSLRIPAAPEAAMHRAPRASTSDAPTRRARNPFLLPAIGPLNRQGGPDLEIVQPDDRGTGFPGRHRDPAAGLVEGGFRQNRRRRADGGRAAVRGG